MAANRPRAVELLDAGRTALAGLGEAGPKQARYQLRLALGAIDIVRRELRDGAELAERERTALATLLHRDADTVAALREALCAALRDGTFPPDDPAVLAALRVAAESHLAIDNPDLAALPPRDRAPS